MKVLDSLTFGCTSCGEPVAVQGVVLTDSFTYIFVANCACGAQNHFKLVSILNALSPTIVAEGSKQVN